MPHFPRAALAAFAAAAVVAAAGCGSSSAPDNLTATVTVENAKPKGGVQELKVKKNGEVHLTVTSDTADEIHVHGYDLTKDVEKGGTVTFDFPAKLDGRFEIELEDHRTPIADLSVEP